jgi:L,D-peptidoglycan transpeptidase YkuD (ErfK/YbiS/YcfS/YnhG family)
MNRRDLISGLLTCATTDFLTQPNVEQLKAIAFGSSNTGVLSFASEIVNCSFGRSGISSSKKEGDGATPAGDYQLREVFYRADRESPPRTRLPLSAIRESDAWCDDASDPAYNRLVARPYQRSTESLWRSDSLYDIVVVIGYNDQPVRPGAGSAIFLHIAREKAGILLPTSGCIAVKRQHLLHILQFCTIHTTISIRKISRAA